MATMITNGDIAKLKEVFATKEDFAKLSQQIGGNDTKVDTLTERVDNLTGRVDNLTGRDTRSKGRWINGERR